MSADDAELMKARAIAFLRNADRLMEEHEWDLAMFNLEQYCQLMLKYKLLVQRGIYPKTHSLRTLIRILGENNPGLLTMVEDSSKLHYVARLEEAYIVSRYMPYRFEEKEVRDVYRFVVEVFKPFVEKL
ncbi:conserved hypothetical protein [Candidatus Caldarchaeum subterraneum]|uniref:HEPN domain-containing protein n=2 Tax=Caldiarchaeum subterraneum TaxID=311458 RepID=E6P926_CALS0|nr:conserved hypothetical protein [Candidatus Caldarchaeum subterraneum]